jgi:DNA-directed RNA polymerase specialized sigma24 family protein
VPAAGPSPEYGNVGELSDTDLVQKLQADAERLQALVELAERSAEAPRGARKIQAPANPLSRIANELWRRHENSIGAALRKKIYKGGLCPSTLTRDDFFDSCKGRAFINFLTKIHGFGFRGSLSAWFYKVGETSSVDEFRIIKRQQREFDTRPPDEDDLGTAPLEPVDADQAFVHRGKYKQLRKRYAPDPLEATATQEQKQFALNLLLRHARMSDANLRSARVIRLRFWRDLGYAEIARADAGPEWSEREKNRREKDIERTLEDDCDKMFALSTSEHRFAPSDL